MDLCVRDSEKSCRPVEFIARPRPDSGLYARLEVRSKDNSLGKEVWLRVSSVDNKGRGDVLSAPGGYRSLDFRDIMAVHEKAMCQSLVSPDPAVGDWAKLINDNP
jgi:hypothetical protein